MGLLIAIVFGIVCKLGWFNTPYDWLILFILWWAPFKRGRTWFKINDINVGNIGGKKDG